MQPQYSLRKQDWNTSPAEVNHKSSSKANLLLYNNLIQIKSYSNKMYSNHANINKKQDMQNL